MVSESVVRRGGDRAGKMFVAGMFQGFSAVQGEQFLARVEKWMR